MLKGKSKATAEGPLSFQDALDTYEPGPMPDSINPSSIAYILFTSGTTSIPKAVQISHKALWANLDTITRVYRMDADSRIFNILTTYHTDGIIQGPVLAALNQATWYHPMEFAVDQIPRIFDSIYKYRITHFITVPTMLAFLEKFSEGFEDAFSGEEFQSIVTSASPFEAELWRSFEATFNTQVVNNYGLTETVAGASYCGPDQETRKLGTIGKPIDCEFKIIDEEGRELGPNERGELLIRGDNMLTSYLNNEEATNAAIQDGWFYTGDMAVRDEDGFYSLIGRKKNIIISGGINIQPEEVSEVINTHPAILESVCIGQPDELFGEKLVACVVRDSGSQVEESALIEHCRQELEPAKIPASLYFIDELPKTISGKIQVRAVREFLDSGALVDSGSDTTFLEGIYASASDAFRVSKEELSLGSCAENVDGWDSMAHLIFVTNLEKQFKVRFNSKEIMVLNSLAEAENILKKKLN
jgi:long-chain acyl-CoA synthetase